jgi:glycosyltransferase involved in cell wall biosynthesis
MLPVSHPEWTGRTPGALQRRGFETLLPQAAAVVSVSQDSANELRRLTPEATTNLPIAYCRLADAPPAEPLGEPSPEVKAWLGKTYVLCVSSMGVRKNHALLVEAWRRLWRARGDAIPQLILVGGGQPNPQLAALMASERGEGGKVAWLRGVDDAGLEALYRDAWMTAYPSFAEGYGMPVAESLARGKVCLAGDTLGVREAGAGLIDTIDPSDPATLADAVSAYLADPDSLARREAEIRRRYRPTRWSDTAAGVRGFLEAHAASANPPIRAQRGPSASRGFG